MLARRGPPFDSKEHLFEIKWDGFRALAFTEGTGYRLLSRRKTDLAPRYPELAFLAEVERGVILDGEIIVFRDGQPDFEALLRREQARSARTARALADSLPVAYVAFDLLYRGFEPVLEQPLVERRAALREIVEARASPRFVFSDGITGAGTAFFEKVTDQGLEGIVAKKLQSPYQPGRRTGAWTKIKRSERAHCAIIGYREEGGDLKSLIVATDLDGELRSVGKVGSGLEAGVRKKLLPLLRARVRPDPLVPCRESGTWVEPGLYCTVTYVERTKGGNLRAPVFDELIVDE